jgi:hypothetical protein
MEKTFSPGKRPVIVLLLILGVLLSLCAIFIVKSWLKTQQDPQSVSATLSRVLGRPVNVEKVSISLGGRLILKNVTIYTPDEIKRRREMLTAPLIIASFSPWKIIMGQYEKSLTSVNLGEPALHIFPATLQWFQNRLHTWKGALPSASIKSGTLEISGFPLISRQQFKNIRGILKLRNLQWECNLNGASSDLRQKWEFLGKGPLSGKPLMKVRGQNVEISDFFDEKALEGLPRLKGRADFEAEYLEPDGLKGKVQSGKLTCTLKVGGTSQAMNGRRDLDKPPGLREGIASANVEMNYYFLIGGTPKDPLITPQTTGPKFNVSPGGIMHFFEKLTH